MPPVMQDEHRITRPEQYASVYEKGNTWVSNLVVIKALPNGLPSHRYGISVSRRVGKAVVRNKVRRRVREIMRAAPIKPGWDIVIIARQTSARADYRQIKESIESALSRARLLEKYEADRLRAN